ncbi:hypothetical protein K469DRAFT_684017 [Zopfia rhizophila CBS 207.26]|uniref:SET domain-containing protein n=1 Tax=Zopfia rhizophila CBS 207.26 TaxID=1314779 RepID=A0A6A6DAV6_9PEZI|nr:hypothetical protein K469DRAFT_684017 [Zopfia rhizophila CBS 207.26]
MTREAPLEVDALIAKVEGVLSGLKKIKDEIQQPRLRPAAYRKTTRSHVSFNLGTISQILQGIVQVAQRLQAGLEARAMRNPASAKGSTTTVLKNAQGENTQSGDSTQDDENAWNKNTQNDENTVDRGADATLPDNDQNTQNNDDSQNENSQNNGNLRNELAQNHEHTQDDGNIRVCVRDRNISEDHTQITRYQEGHLQHPITDKSFRRQKSNQALSGGGHRRIRSSCSNVTPTVAKRKGVSVLNPPPKKKRSTCSSELNELIKEIQASDCSLGLTFQKSDRRASIRLTAAILSKKTIERCIALIRAWRSSKVLPVDAFRPTTNDCIGRAAAFARSAQLYEANTGLDILLVRLAELNFALEMDEARAGAIRTNKRHIDDVLNRLQWPQAKRKALEMRLANGRKWQKICGELGTGLLCLIPFTSEAPCCVSQDFCHRLIEEDIDAFHVLVEEKRQFIDRLCKFGTLMLDMLLKDQNIEFQCESSQVSSLMCTEDDLLSFLEPVQYPETNFYQPVDGWLKPRNWQWDWPMDPTWTPPDYECDLCQATQCDCISNLPKNCYRIIQYGAKGRGIQARASYQGGLTFRKDEYIGELTGELVPPETYNNGMALDFHRPDIIDEPVVCQVYCEKKGNWVRLVNHSCKPCARFVIKVVSGKARVMLQAIRDIWDGEEVTANYGRNFFKNKDCLCQMCAQSNQATIDSRTLSSPNEANNRDNEQQPSGSLRYPIPPQTEVNDTCADEGGVSMTPVSCRASRHRRMSCLDGHADFNGQEKLCFDMESSTAPPITREETTPPILHNIENTTSSSPPVLALSEKARLDRDTSTTRNQIQAESPVTNLGEGFGKPLLWF